MKFFSKIKKIKKNKKPNFIPPFDEYLYEWDKDFKIGDDVYYLGHDGVGGAWYGYKYKVDQEMVDKKENISFYRLKGFKNE